MSQAPIGNELRSPRWERLAEQLGPRYSDCSLDNFEVSSDPQRAVVEQLSEYAAAMQANVKRGRCIVLYGPPGTGKDHLMAAMMRLAFVAGCPQVHWEQGCEMLKFVREAMWFDEEPRFGADVLAVSDPLPPSGALSEWQAQQLFRIVDHRYRRLHPIWTTLNVASSDEAAARMGPQVVDRITHNALVLACQWPSYRSKGGGA